MENQRSLSDCFLWIEAEVISHNKFQLSAGEPPQLSGAPAGSLDFIKVWISNVVLMNVSETPSKHYLNGLSVNKSDKVITLAVKYVQISKNFDHECGIWWHK